MRLGGLGNTIAVAAMTVLASRCGPSRPVAPAAAPAPIASVPRDTPGSPQEEALAAAAPVAVTSSVAAEMPARFLAPMPRTADEWQRWDFDLADCAGGAACPWPPTDHVRDLACQGDEEMNERVLAGLRAAVAAEAAAGARAFDTRVLRYCEHDAVRAFALRVVSGDDAPRVKAAWWQILPHFDGDDVARAFERADAPDEEVLIWAVVQDAGRWTQRLQDAVFRRMDERPFDTSRVAGILARTRDPRSIDALLERHRVEPDGRIRRGIAIGLGESRDPRARAVFDAACRAARDPSCPTALTEKLEGEDAALVGESWAGMNPEEFAAGNPGRDEGVRRVLDACACAPIYASWEPGGCLAQLARGDWPHARDVARGCTIETVAEVAELRAGLVGFASREELVKHLAQLGLLRPGDRVDARDVSSREILERALRVDEFWARRQSSDAEEAQVLRELAWLVRPELQGFAFEAHVGARDSIEPTVLAAYGAGRKWTVTTARTPQSDVAALVGLVNAILRDRGSDALVAVVKARTSTGPWDFMPPGPDVGAVGGPADGIRQAAADGLITLEDAASVENDGW